MVRGKEAFSSAEKPASLEEFLKNAAQKWLKVISSDGEMPSLQVQGEELKENYEVCVTPFSLEGGEETAFCSIILPQKAIPQATLKTAKDIISWKYRQEVNVHVEDAQRPLDRREMWLITLRFHPSSEMAKQLEQEKAVATATALALAEEFFKKIWIELRKEEAAPSPSAKA